MFSTTQRIKPPKIHNPGPRNKNNKRRNQKVKGRKAMAIWTFDRGRKGVWLICQRRYSTLRGSSYLPEMIEIGLLHYLCSPHIVLPSSRGKECILGNITESCTVPSPGLPACPRYCTVHDNERQTGITSVPFRRRRRP